MTIEEKRRELFESWWARQPHKKQPQKFLSGDYIAPSAHNAWVVWNAALDAVVIELPAGFCDEECGGVIDCRAAIESTGLGLKVLP